MQRDLRLLMNAMKLWRTRRTQALLSMLGVMSGVCGVVLVIALGEGAEREVDAALGSLGAGSVIIRTEAPETLDSQLFTATTALFQKSLTTQTGTLFAVSPVAADDAYLDEVRLMGTDSQHASLYSQTLHRGRLLAPHDVVNASAVCVVDWHLGQSLFPRGQVLGSYLRYGNSWCQVIGWLADDRLRVDGAELGGIVDADPTLYLPTTTLAGRRQQYPLSEVTLHFASERVLSDALPVLRRMVERQFPHTTVEFVVPLELLRQKQRVQLLFQSLLLGIAFVLLLVGGTGIMNTMLLNVISRRPEIGLRLAIGATRRDIIVQFVGESLAVALAGGIVGIIVGALAAVVASASSPWEFLFNYSAALAGFFAALLTGVLFGGYPAVMAARVSPIKTLQTG